MLQAQQFKSLKEWVPLNRARAIAGEWHDLIDLAKSGLQDVYIIDTETTGFSNADTIIELALVNLANGNTVMHQYYNPIVASHPAALAVHGLTPKKLKEKGAVDWDVISAGVLENVVEGAIILEWSTGFDKRMVGLSLDAAYSDIGCQVDTEWRSPMLDYNIYKGEVNGTGKGFKRHKLRDACTSSGLEWSTSKAHGALYDAQMVYNLMITIADKQIGVQP